ncbi:MAG: ABC transporter ATP-binding protein [SAR324 cluster bacterium]|nr:ABC transporter ATP-binding protein [SAR324 cluster bacterium]
MEKKIHTTTKSNYFWYIKLAWQQKYYYFTGIILLAFTNFIVLKIPLYLKEAFDIIQSADKIDNNELTNVLSMVVLFSFLVVTARTFSRVLFFNPARRVESDIKNIIYKKLNRIKSEYYAEKPPGSILSILNNDIVYVRLLYGFGLLQSINLIFMFTLAPISMWAISPKLTLYCLIPLFVGVVVVRIGIYYVIHYTKKRSQDLQKISTFSISVLNGFDVIKSYQIEPWSKIKFNEHNAALLHSTIGIMRASLISRPILINLENVLKIIVFAVVGTSLLSSNFSVGDLAAFLSYITLLTPPIASIGWLSNLFKQGSVAIKNINSVYHQPQREQGLLKPTTDELAIEFDKGITINNLMFKYPKADNMALCDISFKIMPGEIIGVLGKVGSGKTTLAYCLSKILPTNREMIKIGDLDMVDIDEDSVRNIVLAVSQDAFLFSATIKDNILLSADRDKDNITPEELAAVIDAAALREEIDQFPNKEMELVGEKGITLSGGQKQRVTIARAFFRKQKLLILDNVLSAVDYATENYLIEQIVSKKYADSLLIISHKINTLKKANRILVLDGGKITEQGTHDQLLEMGGIYADAYRLQH